MADWQAGSTTGGGREQAGPGGEGPVSSPILLLLPTACLVVLVGALIARSLSISVARARR